MQPEGRMECSACAVPEGKQPVRRRRLPASFKVSASWNGSEERREVYATELLYLLFPNVGGGSRRGRAGLMRGGAAHCGTRVSTSAQQMPCIATGRSISCEVR